MRRFAQRAILKADAIETYRQLHAAVWPELLELLARANIYDYTIYLHSQTGELLQSFSYSGDNYDADCRRAFDGSCIAEQWASVTDVCFAEPWSDLEEIFHVD